MPDSSFPKNYTTGAPGTAAVVKSSTKKDLAWTFAKYYCTDPDNQILSAAYGGWFPLYIPEGRENEFFDTFLQDSRVKVEDAQALTEPWEYFNEKPIGPVGSVYGRVIEEELPLYYNGDRDLASTLDIIEKRVNDEIERVGGI